MGRGQYGSRPVAPPRDHLGLHSARARRSRAPRGHRHALGKRRADPALGQKKDSVQLEPQQRVRIALEELGPTFVKLGQMLSTREDLLPQPWTAEFERLQSEARPVPFEELLPQLEQALGRSPFEVFVDLEREPYASASIAQVHRAKLPNGTPVILKIRRPGILAKIDSDLRLFAHVADLVEHEMPEARRYRPARMVAEFRRSLDRELDLGVEARNIGRFARNFADDPYILIPRVYGEWTSGVINVQDHIAGIPGNDLAAIEAAGLDRKVLAERGVDAVLKMILVDGFFHADPHPGNVLYLTGNRIVMIDFGMVGRLTPMRRGQIVDLLAGITHQDEEPMLEVLLDWAGEEVVDETQLATDIAELAFDYADLQVKDLRIATLLHRVVAIMREHPIMLPADLTLMFKALITLEGLGHHYDPEFQLISGSSRSSSGRWTRAIGRPRSCAEGRRPLEIISAYSPRCRETSRGSSRT